MLITIWFMLWALLWAVYFMLDGFDLGAGALLPVAAKNARERAIVHNAIGPFWDGNEVWLIAAGGVTFAAFPLTFGVMFSGLYSAFMLLLFTLILRGAALGLRGETESQAGKRAWDLVLTATSILAPLLFGAAFANIFHGLPLDREHPPQGAILPLLNPYAIIGAALFLAFAMEHGMIWLAVKTGGEVQARARQWAKSVWIALALIAVAFDIFTAFATNIWQGYLHRPYLFIIPLVNLIALVMARVFMAKEKWLRAFAASCVFIVSGTFFGLAGIYPAMVPSSLDPEFTVTAAMAASSPLTLKIMLGVVLVLVPIIIAYQTWVYVLFKGKAEDNEYGYGE
ncbi:MAG TPA: cytochrome d ubiquinol oxidase subunit II [bacterium]|nr:cytochrome d ubiquinol oxidase subunit II [bacterium]